MTRIHLYYEDTFGNDFFKELIKRLKNERRIDRNISFGFKHLQCFCNPKIDRILKADDIKYNPNQIIITCDGDDQVLEKKVEMEGHVSTRLQNKTALIIIETEIEEWICLSKGFNFQGKPSRYLEYNHGYKKRNLNKYVSDLNIDRLIQESGSFSELMNIIQSF